MPKDAKKNIDRYKIRGGELNEFDFHQHQEEFAEQQKGHTANLIPGTAPEAKAARATNTNTATKSTKDKKATPARGASAKKLAERKAAKKK